VQTAFDLDLVAGRGTLDGSSYPSPGRGAVQAVDPHAVTGWALDGQAKRAQFVAARQFPKDWFGGKPAAEKYSVVLTRRVALVHPSDPAVTAGRRKSPRTTCG
jgi:hypothetical protein